MKFTKMHGIGNDYVYVNCLEETVTDPAAVAIQVSDRHTGIGSDGLILIKPSETADFMMDMYNADGSRGKMCGNGIRCVAKYVYDYGLTDKTTICVETLAGIKEIQLTVKDGKVEKACVNMGQPGLTPEQVPVLAKGTSTVGLPVVVDNHTYDMTCVGMGNPHAVVYMEDVAGLQLETIGPGFEKHPMFPERVNTEFVKVLDPTHLEMRVWERGSGETFACGTGACATLVASVLNGYSQRRATVHLLGGDLDIFWNPNDNCVYMTGPATTVFDGEIEI